jgi:hypothetical protein
MKTQLLCLTCNTCNVQLFCRSERSDEAWRSVMKPVAKVPVAAPEDKPAVPAVVAAEAAPTPPPVPAAKRPAWGLLGG